MFLEHLERMEYSSETKSGYEKDLEFFSRYMIKRRGNEEILVQQISKEDILGFMDLGKQMGHAPNTIGRRVSTIKSFYKYLVYELDYPIDLAARIKLPKKYIPLRDILSESEVQRLLDYTARVDRMYHLLYAILYYTGSRLTPVRTLERRNVLLEQGILYFPMVKGGKDLYLPIHNKLMELFEIYFHDQKRGNGKYVFPSPKFPTQPISAADIRLKLKKHSRGADIEKHVIPHSIRHSTATHLTIKKVDQRTIASILGHSDLRSTMRYQHLAIEHLREPINVL